MLKTMHLQWLAGLAVLLFAAGCPVDVNDGTDDGGPDPTANECMPNELATVRFMHAAGGTPVTRRPGVTSTRNLNVTRPDPKDPAKTLTVTSLAAGRAGASADRATHMITLTPDADSSLFDVGVTLVLAGISDALKMDGTPENPKSVADPLRFIEVRDTFGTGSETQLQVVHASRKTPPLVDVEANPDRSGVEINQLMRYTVSPVVATKGTPDTAPASVPVVFLENGTTRSTHTIAPRMPAGAKGLAILFDTEVFDPDNPDPAGQNPAPTARLFLTGDDPLLGSVAGGGVQF